MAANLEISTVVGCKIRCSYCPQKTHVAAYGANPRVLALETFVQCLETVPTNVDIVFAGMAEPWQNPHCTDMLLHAHTKGHRVSVFTTCAYMTVEDVERIRHVPFVHFCIHLPDSRMGLRVDDSYLAVLQAAVTVPGHNFIAFGEQPRVIQDIVRRSVRDDSAGLISRAGNLQDRAIARKTGKLRCSACGVKIDHNVMLPNGDVALCCMVYDLRHILGNLTQTAWSALFESDEYQRIMRGLDGDESIDIACRNCEMAVPVK